MSTKEHQAVQNTLMPRRRLWRWATAGCGLVAFLACLRLFLISPNPVEAVQILRASFKVKRATTSEEEKHAFEFCRTETRIWEMSYKDTNGQWLDYRSATGGPSAAGSVRIEWLGLFRDVGFEHRLIAPTNLLVLTAD
jgi:hypothetical protein